MSDETTGAEIVREIKERRGKTTWLLSLDRRREFCVHSRPDFSGRRGQYVTKVTYRLLPKPMTARACVGTPPSSSASAP